MLGAIVALIPILASAPAPSPLKPIPLPPPSSPPPSQPPPPPQVQE